MRALETSGLRVKPAPIILNPYTSEWAGGWRGSGGYGLIGKRIFLAPKSLLLFHPPMYFFHPFLFGSKMHFSAPTCVFR